MKIDMVTMLGLVTGKVYRTVAAVTRTAGRSSWSFVWCWQTWVAAALFFVAGWWASRPAPLPADAALQIKNAIVAAFNGADGGPRARIGSSIFASRFYAAIAALGNWALIYSVLVGVGTANRTSVLIAIDHVPTVDATDISVNFS